ncbi:DUF1566 domain-containing protein [Ideonella oryzae]|uniref:DUF1566 domain-containing protein n=1 Tax=Ideonella oryzae TaxID=2937441 RepID=A0ABT1BHL6_9BURK|nr:DUF1566 domain-containing protein [Ideonella oryzae]MCO5975424.1 DUF1566 domain-containing protein [Ideonella oryzae]
MRESSVGLSGWRVGLLALGWLIGTPAAQAGPAEEMRAAGFALVDEGAGVLDQRTGLVWARCVQGMQWNGRQCSGQATPLAQEVAMRQAAALQKGQTQGPAWRLPHVADLRRLSNRLSKEPQLQPLLFPQAPRGLYWTDSRVVGESQVNPYNYGNIEQGRTQDNAVQLRFLHAWTVDPLSTAEPREEPKRATHWVRLVRPMP